MGSTKTINETFTEDEYNELIAAKGDLNWHDFILLLTTVKLPPTTNANTNKKG